MRCPAHHRIGDAGQARDLRRNRGFGIFQAFVAINHAVEPAALAPVLAGGDGEVDDPVSEVSLEGRRLGVDHGEPAAGLAADVVGKDLRIVDAQAAQYAVVGVSLEYLGGVVDVHCVSNWARIAAFAPG